VSVTKVKVFGVSSPAIAGSPVDFTALPFILLFPIIVIFLLLKT
jgi:hypothetical protein